uniref:glycosyltransferase n=1 Tax=Kribbia dieselivorans TaxID=331526 RepID=UPI000839492D
MSASPDAPVGAVTPVTAVVVIDRAGDGVGDTLTALAGQSHPLDRLVIVDRTGRALPPTALPAGPGLARAEVFDAALTPRLSTRGAVRAVLRRHDELETLSDSEVLWLLTATSVPDGDALARLMAVLHGSRSVELVGPMQVRHTDPSRVRRLGLQATRLGRLVPDPVPGTPDQGQFDERQDVLAVPMEGMLVRRSVFERLDGHDDSFGTTGADLDLGWRAQELGHRVAVVPGAHVRVGGSGHVTDADRRHARQVALARSRGWLAPLLGLWILITAGLTALLLVLTKRPHLARREIVAASGVFGVGAIIGSAWRHRHDRRVSSADLRSLFVSTATAWGDLADRSRSEADPRPDDITSSAAEDPHPSVLAQPVLWVVLAATAMAAIAGRHVAGGVWRRFTAGLAGGEMPGVAATGGDYARTWLQGWSGPGWGSATEASPAHLLLGVPAWLVGWLPRADALDSPVGFIVTLLMLTALPIGALNAYLAAAVLTRSPWVRAVGALAWASTAAAVGAVAQGRVGPAVAVMLVPPVAAGLVKMARPQERSSGAAAGTAILTAVIGSFVPPLMWVALLAGVVLLLRGPWLVRRRALGLIALPLLLLGPWLSTLVARPAEALAGWGATQWGPAAPWWRLALGDPGGAGTTIGLTLPVLIVGLAALLLARRRSALMWATALTTLVGLAVCVLAPTLILDRVPLATGGASSPAVAGSAVTMWPGVGALVMMLGLIGAALAVTDPEQRASSRPPS